MKIRPVIWYALIALAVLAGVAVLAYHIGYNRSKAQLSSLQKEMEHLEAAGKDAAIVKRVSQQMEDIAYQQKAISDQQRDRAEEQSALAVQNARKAELESRLAHEAELKAQSAAQVAQQERANAERQQEIALEQRDEANHAKNVADTLNRRTQARSLAVSSQVRREAGETEVADLLAYGSWYFLKNNRGNQYYSDTFKSLTQATDGIPRYRVREGGSVNAISKVPGSPGQCVAVTNYGEVEWLVVKSSSSGKKISSKRLLFNSQFDFRDVVVLDDRIYALSLKGPLCLLERNGNVRTVDLPQDNYFKLLPVGGRLLVAGRNSLCWYAEGNVSGRVELAKKLSALVEREGVIGLFYSDGSYAQMDPSSGRIVEKTPFVKNVVTAAHYDRESQCLLLGVEDGTVYPVNSYNRVLETLAAHKSKCMDITMLGPVVVTGGYDKTVYIWNMDNLMFESGLSFREELERETVEKRMMVGKEIPTEWLVPVDYTFDGWTLAVCADADGKSVWIGTSSGSVMLLNSSADEMAEQLHRKLKRNLTQQEWTRYVGVSIPYMTFK